MKGIILHLHDNFHPVLILRSVPFHNYTHQSPPQPPHPRTFLPSPSATCPPAPLRRVLVVYRVTGEAGVTWFKDTVLGLTGNPVYQSAGPWGIRQPL